MPASATRATIRPPRAAALLAWYDRNARDLPWRARPGETADPYRVWLSEIMLQQTTVAAADSYFRAFAQRWPRVEDLAAAPLAEVLAAWAGLGYYARARNLHAAARLVAASGGKFPNDVNELRALPGVGPYTAAAIAAIAFGRRAAAVDSNVFRVMARLFAVEQPMPGAKARLAALAESLVPAQRPGDYAQAVMDLGATICTPRLPDCAACPWRANCVAHRRGIADRLPAKAAKAARPTRYGVAFWLKRGDGAVLLRRRPARGLLGGMMEIPSTPWRATPWTLDAALAEAPARTRWRAVPGTVSHVFTHFALELRVVAGRAGDPNGTDGDWCPARELDARGLPSVMKKIARHAQSSGTGAAA